MDFPPLLACVSLPLAQKPLSGVRFPQMVSHTVIYSNYSSYHTHNWDSAPDTLLIWGFLTGPW